MGQTAEIQNSERITETRTYADIYAYEQVKKTGPWIDGTVYKTAKISFQTNANYYNSEWLELGSFELDIPSILDRARENGILIFSYSSLVGMGDSLAGDQCTMFIIEVYGDYTKLRIGFDGSNHCTDNLKAVLEKY